MVSILRALIVLLVLCGAASAQTCTGNIPAGTVCGNPTGAPAPARPMTSTGGGGAGNVIIYDTPAAFVAPPASINYVTVASMNGVASGTTKDACSLSYQKGGTTPTGVPGELNKGGTYWQPIYDISPIRACQFGTIGNGTADDTAAIQAALDYAIRYIYGSVCLNDGNYKTSDTLHVGYGFGLNPVNALSLVSCNMGRDAYVGANVGGVQINPTKTDRCAINFQGSRRGALRGISLQGLSDTYILNNVIGGAHGPYPPVASGWFDPALAPVQASFTGSITGTTLTVSSGTGIAPGQTVLDVAGTSVAPGTTIVSGAGTTWTVNLSQTVGSTSMTSQASGGLTRYSPYAAVCVDAYANGTISQFTATMSGTTMVVSAVGNPTPIRPGQTLLGAAPVAVVPNTVIVSQTSGTPGGIGNYVISQNNTITTGEVMQGYGPPNVPTMYPSVTYPSWTGITSQYNKYSSSDVEFTNVSIRGFAVGFVTQPGGFQANADFMKFDKIQCLYSTHCVSISHNQSRNVQFTNIGTSGLWTALSNDAFGAQIGTLGLYCGNVTVANGYQLFSVQMQAQGDFSCHDMYSEELVRIGDFHNGGAFSGMVTLDGCSFNFYDENVLLSPAAIIEITGNVDITLRSCSLNGVARMTQLVHGNIQSRINIEGGGWQAGQDTGWIGAAAPTSGGGIGIQTAMNWSGSNFIGTPYAFQSVAGEALYVRFLLGAKASGMATPTSDGGSTNIFLDEYAKYNGLRIPHSQAMKGLVDLHGQLVTFISKPYGAARDLSTDSHTPPIAISCDILTMGWDSSLQGDQSTRLNVGDILYYHPDGTIFIVTSVGAVSGGFVPVTARQMNNMTYTNTPNNGTCLASKLGTTAGSVGLTGNTYIIHTTTVIPAILLFGDFVNGQTTVSNIGPLGGQTLSNIWNANDPIWAFNLNGVSGNIDAGFAWPYNIGTQIATVAGGAGNSLTLNQASLFTGRFPLMPLQVAGGRIKSVIGAETAGVPFSQLPGCNSTFTAGLQAVVNDSTTIVMGTLIAGGGSNLVQAVCSSGNLWIVSAAVANSGSPFSAVPPCFATIYRGLRAIVNNGNTGIAVGNIASGSNTGTGTVSFEAICNSAGNWIVQTLL